MKEKLLKIEENKNPEEKIEASNFDKEEEKKYRQEVRKIIVKALSEALEGTGLMKAGYSTWQRKIKNTWQILYLQRSQWGHQYYIEAGVGNDLDIPKGQKPDIVYCKIRERIEGIIDEIEKEKTLGEKEKKDKIGEKVNTVNAALDFEAPGVQEKYPEDYFLPSVDIEEAKRKIEIIKKNVAEYAPLWFNKHSE